MAKVFKLQTLSGVTTRFRSDLKDLDYVLLYVENTEKQTRLGR